MTTDEVTAPEPELAKPATLFQVLGPGLITGASDDDPSGIATYSQAGAQFGYDLGWVLLLSVPLMCAIQEISARVGRVTGRGLAGVIKHRYPAPVVYAVVALLVAANIINLGADLGAMAAALNLLIGGPPLAYVAGFAVIIGLLEIFMRYSRYVLVLKWLTLSLFAYAAVAFAVRTPWSAVAYHLVVPNIAWKASYFTVVVALLGTTISPYLFFWQAEEEVEEVKERDHAKPLERAPEQAKPELRRIRIDTYVGMIFSNLVALFIIMSTAATLHAHGVTNIETSSQAALALKPIAGPFVFLIFGLGIIGTGLLAVPVLAGSACYALGEAFGWHVGLSRRPDKAQAFYGAIAAATAIGALLNFTPIDPIKALFWSAVINGVVAVPVMVMILLVSTSKTVMGEFTLSRGLSVLGWLTTAVMGVAAGGMIATMGQA
jgi:NRAMP (natural resistance-associated macrophage protein)-like metal ion transporter